MACPRDSWGTTNQAFCLRTNATRLTHDRPVRVLSSRRAGAEAIVALREVIRRDTWRWNRFKCSVGSTDELDRQMAKLDRSPRLLSEKSAVVSHISGHEVSKFLVETGCNWWYYGTRLDHQLRFCKGLRNGLCIGRSFSRVAWRSGPSVLVVSLSGAESPEGVQASG